MDGVGEDDDQPSLHRLGLLLGDPRLDPAEVEQRRLGLADIAGQAAIADGKPRLSLQRLELLLDLGDDVVDAFEVLLGGLEAQFRLVPARMQTGNAGRLFEQRPALLRLGGDQFADLALPHQGGRMGAGRGIGEQQLHVAGPHFLAVDPVDRAGLALDAPRHFEDVGSVEGRRGGAVRRCREPASLRRCCAPAACPSRKR